jgi:precorrin-4 C11-methyltransferase (EC 2.1.1.133)
VTVHFIGAGPGAYDLLTLRAVRLLESSPVCLYAGTYLDAQVLAHCPADARLVDTQHLNLDEITAVLVEAHAAGQDVARLCSGDPSIYSAVAEQARRLDAAGVPWDVTPGCAGLRRHRSDHRPGAHRAGGRPVGGPHARSA